MSQAARLVIRRRGGSCLVLVEDQGDHLRARVVPPAPCRAERGRPAPRRHARGCIPAGTQGNRTSGWPARTPATDGRDPSTVVSGAAEAHRAVTLPGAPNRAGKPRGSRLRDSYPPTVNLRPSADWPDRAIVAVNVARVAAVIDRVAADVDELARARRVQDLTTAAVPPDRRAERRRRLAEPIRPAPRRRGPQPPRHRTPDHR